MKTSPRAGLILAAGLALTTGCGVDVVRSLLSVRHEHVGSPRLREFASMDAVHRDSLGLAPLPTAGGVKIERRFGRDAEHAGYDAVLAFVAPPGKTVEFVRVGGRYAWSGESERHYGPKTFPTPDGWQHEQIAILYHLHATTTAPQGLKILYWGTDTALTRRELDLTLADVRPVLRQWDSLRAAHEADD